AGAGDGQAAVGHQGSAVQGEAALKGRGDADRQGAAGQGEGLLAGDALDRLIAADGHGDRPRAVDHHVVAGTWHPAGSLFVAPVPGHVPVAVAAGPGYDGQKQTVLECLDAWAEPAWPLTGALSPGPPC